MRRTGHLPQIGSPRTLLKVTSDVKVKRKGTMTGSHRSC
jgi:hypothetical protein